MISNFSQVRYYLNYPYDSSNIVYQQPNYPYFYSNNIISQQPNTAIQPCPAYNFFGGSSIYQKLSFQDNYGTLGAYLNLSEFIGNLSRDRTEDPNNISGCSNLASEVVLTHVEEYSDD
jgi:hypothetical protein